MKNQAELRHAKELYTQEAYMELLMLIRQVNEEGRRDLASD